MNVEEIPLADLGALEEIGDGGQGRVYRLPARPGYLLKRYHPHVLAHLDVRELRRLIARPARMDPADRRYLTEVAAWPVATVTDGGTCVGFLMPTAPDRFTAVLGSGQLLEIQYLVYPVKRMWQTLWLPGADERREIAKRYARYFQLLHRYDVIVGDVSSRNLLWTLRGGPGIFALDCDSYRINGHHPALPQGQTPDWVDPSVEGERATLDSDRYKLALLIIRILLGQPYLTPHQVMQDQALRGQLDDALLSLVERAAKDAGRPEPVHWLRALEGRPTLSLSPPPSRPATTVSRQPPQASAAPTTETSPAAGPAERPRLRLTRAAPAGPASKPADPADPSDSRRPTLRLSKNPPPRET